MKLGRKEKLELGITVVLVFVILLVARPAKKSPGPKKNAQLTEALSPAPADSKVKPNKELYNMLEEKGKELKLKRDPFTGVPISEEISTSAISLTGILWDKQRPMAIIGQKVVEKGERIGNKTVVEIKQDRIILNDGDKLYEIKLGL